MTPQDRAIVAGRSRRRTPGRRPRAGWRRGGRTIEPREIPDRACGSPIRGASRLLKSHGGGREIALVVGGRIHGQTIAPVKSRETHILRVFLNGHLIGHAIGDDPVIVRLHHKLLPGHDAQHPERRRDQGRRIVILSAPGRRPAGSSRCPAASALTAGSSRLPWILAGNAGRRLPWILARSLAGILRVSNCDSRAQQYPWRRSHAFIVTLFGRSSGTGRSPESVSWNGRISQPRNRRKETQAFRRSSSRFMAAKVPESGRQTAD